MRHERYVALFLRREVEKKLVLWSEVETKDNLQTKCVGVCV